MTAEGMSARLSFGFGFGMITAQRDPRDLRTDADLYADAIDLCVLAEQLGFDAAWLSEHHFVDDGYMPSPLPVAAAIALRTSTLTVGSEEFAGFGRSKEKIGPVLDHVIDALRCAWKGSPVQTGPDASPVIVTPRPPHPPRPHRPEWKYKDMVASPSAHGQGLRPSRRRSATRPVRHCSARRWRSSQQVVALLR